MEATIETSSAAGTERVAAVCARHLAPGDVVLVAGDLGSGKTTFVRGACRALGVAGAVISPTYTIGRVHNGHPPVAHVDLFRLDSLEQEDPALLDDYLTADRVGFVEWPAVAEAQVTRVRLRVDIELAGGDRRVLTLSGDDSIVAAAYANGDG